MRIVTACLVALAAAAVSFPAAGDGITSDQANEILKELRQIRQLLERQPAPAPVPAPMAAPTPQKVKIVLGKEFALGRADAPVTIVEFNDLQCPFCNRFHANTFPEIRKNYIDTGKVRFVNRDLPLEELHPQAVRAALAARCAAEQDRYWEVAGRIISNYASLTPQSIDQHAKDAGVDAASYQACVDSGRYVDAIRESGTAAKALGVSGTPSFVVGKVKGGTLEGQLLVGALPYATFDAAINEALKP